MTIRLTWTDPNSVELGYRVYRGIAPLDVGNLPAPLASLPANSTSYDDGGVVDGTTYYYVISAYDSTRERVSGQVSLEAGPPVSAVVFFFVGSDQTYTAGAEDFIDVYMWGGGGAGGSRAPISYNDARPGGGAGYSYARVPVSSGDVFTVVVGSGGSQNNTGSANPTVYGGGGSGHGGGNQNGGGGGGRSALILQGVDILIAGGGGGGQSVGGPGTDGGGAGGGTSGANGNNGTSIGGGGGTQSSGGSATGGGGSLNPTAGTALTGGNGGGSDGAGGGGGGGFFGGGGGGGNGSGGSGGGGGSGYVDSALMGVTVAGSGPMPASTDNTYYQSGIGVGGAQREAGGHGLVVIIPGNHI